MPTKIADRGMTVREAGRKGGETTKRRHGNDFYEEIGRNGGNATRDKHGPEFYAKIGKAGGKSSGASRSSR